MAGHDAAHANDELGPHDAHIWSSEPPAEEEVVRCLGTSKEENEEQSW